ncbi:MAG TPA: LON peptidase substrate-binding domain-containing protein [Thermoanaerobaculia bacterium]|jgi:hypothetical protein
MNSDPRIADLPSTIHLMPIEGFILLPETTLPLTIVDAQSRELLDAADAESGYVGLVQGREDDAGSRFFEVGCLARIQSLDRDAEGHHVTLDGVIRFRLREELPPEGNGFSRAAVAYEEFAHDLDRVEEDLPGWNLEAFKDKLVEFGRTRFGTAGILETMTPRQVVRFMAQTTPFTPAERQALLESRGFREMLETLVKLLALNFLTTTPDTSAPEQAN